VFESSKKERYCSLPKKRTREDGLSKKVEIDQEGEVRAKKFAELSDARRK